jgi:ribosome-binding factor A
MAHRLEKINHLIRQEISELLRRETKDPRITGFISVNDVFTTPDLRYARIFVSCVCEESKKKEILNALSAASGFLRSEMAKHLRLRRVPELSFVWDDSIERGSRLIELLDKVSEEGSSGE